MKCLQCLQCLHCLYEMYEMFAMFAMLAVFAMFAVFAGQSAECPSVLRGVQATNLSFSSQVSSIAMMMITVLVVVIIGVTVENNSEIIAKLKRFGSRAREGCSLNLGIAKIQYIS